MKKITFCVLSLIALNASADLPHTFVANTPAKASEVNNNFTYLDNLISNILSLTNTNSENIETLNKLSAGLKHSENYIPVTYTLADNKYYYVQDILEDVALRGKSVIYCGSFNAETEIFQCVDIDIPAFDNSPIEDSEEDVDIIETLSKPVQSINIGNNVTLDIHEVTESTYWKDTGTNKDYFISHNRYLIVGIYQGFKFLPVAGYTFTNKHLDRVIDIIEVNDVFTKQNVWLDTEF